MAQQHPGADVALLRPGHLSDREGEPARKPRLSAAAHAAKPLKASLSSGGQFCEWSHQPEFAVPTPSATLCLYSCPPVLSLEGEDCPAGDAYFAVRVDTLSIPSAQESVEPLLDTYKPPGLIKKIYFRTLTFGDAPFKIDNIWVDKANPEEVTLEVRFKNGFSQPVTGR